LEEPTTPDDSGPPTGQGILPQDGVLQQQQPADEEVARTVEPPTEDETTQPTQEPLPCPEGQVLDEETDLCICPEGQILDEETGLCVLEEQEAVEEPLAEEPTGPQPDDEEQASE
jgi:hypothetical protein